MELSCGRCGRSSYVPDDLVQGRAFRARCPDCDGILEIPAERPTALDDGDLAWLASDGRAPEPAVPVDAPPPAGEVTEQAVDAFARKAGAARRRHGLVVAAGALAAAGALVAALVLVASRAGVGARASQAEREEGETDGAAAVTFDASGLVLRPVAEPPPSPAPAGAAAAPLPRRKAPGLGRDDRKLLDLLARKSDAAVAPPAEGHEVAGAASALDPEVVARTIGASRRAFDACVSKALRANPTLRVARRATLVLTVQPGGRVTGAFVAEEEVDRSELGGCLSAAARRLTFPPFDGEPVDVSMPLSLSAVF